MLVLYHVNDMVLRIVLALISITMFSTLLKIFTAARTAEIYAATAGYAKRAKLLLAMTNKPDLPLSLSSSSGVTTSRKTEKTGLSLGHLVTSMRTCVGGCSRSRHPGSAFHICMSLLFRHTPHADY